jgi:hypothetical protein
LLSPSTTSIVEFSVASSQLSFSFKLFHHIKFQDHVCLEHYDFECLEHCNFDNQVCVRLDWTHHLIVKMFLVVHVFWPFNLGWVILIELLFTSCTWWPLSVSW